MEMGGEIFGNLQTWGVPLQLASKEYGLLALIRTRVIQFQVSKYCTCAVAPLI